ncbi:MAG: hypothetical protein BAJALOKI1v1_600013 [Promethearchaeota archaeon]|nr:MAG: hypothetical protein BAJALOKI1v1_600013 [Candidatus Lokiarchaeota archaeon]
MTDLNNKEEDQKIYDGPYEVAGLNLNNNGEIFKGILYFPPKQFPKPTPLIMYFHEFPQLFPLTEIIKNYKYLLDLGYAIISVNFRGYRYSEGTISLASQVSDGLKLLKFAEKMAEKQFFLNNDLNIIAHDLGGYIALLVCAQSPLISKLLLISPLLNLKTLVEENGFAKTLNYINNLLPGNISGIENAQKFIEMTKNELSKKEFQLKHAIKNLKINHLKIITGREDKICPPLELGIIDTYLPSEISLKKSIIKDMDHDPFEESTLFTIKKEILEFFKPSP